MREKFNVMETKAGRRGMTKGRTNTIGGKVINGRVEGNKGGAMH
jgi:hypothetical protein